MTDKTNIDELLNGYIDGELSPRQKTEVKRLITNDSKIAEKLKKLQLCKKMVSALPQEECPYDLLEDIKSALERKTLLQEPPKHFKGDQGFKHLYIRKIMASAAMISLICVLSVIIYNILKPTNTEPMPIAQTDWKKPAVNDLVENQKTIVKSENIIAEINLETDSFLAANAFIRKTIDEKGILSNDSPANPDGAGIYYVNSDASDINLILADLGSIQQKFTSIDLNIQAAKGNGSHAIKNVNFDQISTIINQKTFDQCKNVALKISATNYARDKNMLAKLFNETDNAVTIPKPVLTSGDQGQNITTDSGNGQKIYLKIKLSPSK